MPDTESFAAIDAVDGGALPVAAAYVVAFSGGRDSTVLLHAMHQSGLPLRALHVVHGLVARGEDWAEHCVAVAAAWGLECRVLRIAAPAPAANREAWAREQRYAALTAALQPDEALLLGHHAQDQAETLLLNLLRGSGPRGLAAMPAQRRLATGHWLLRPLLSWSPEQVEAYAEHHQLRWQEDPSNRDLRYDRNFLRHEILPRLSARYPGAVAALARSAAFAAELVAADDTPPQLNKLRLGEGLSLTALDAMPASRRNRVLFAWLRSQALPLPRRRMLDEIWRQMLSAHDERRPRIRWPGVELWRERESLLARAVASDPVND